MRLRVFLVVILPAVLCALPIPAETSDPPPPRPEVVEHWGPSDAPRHLLVRSTTDIGLIADVLQSFVADHPGLAVDYEQWGSNELNAVEAAACAGHGTAADFVFSSAVDLQVTLVNDGCAQPHDSALTRALPAAANWRNELFGLTSEPAVLVYNRRLVPPDEAPESRFDLLDLLRREDGRYDGKVATYDIEASGLGYLFAFADAEQATTFGSLTEALGRAHAVATCCSAEIIAGVESGRWLVAYNVLGSNALARAAEDADLAVVAPTDYTLILRRAGLIPKGARNPLDAGALIDFLLSEPGRTRLRAAHLIVDPADLVGQDSGADDAVLRPIPLSPVLLVGNDRQRRSQFIALWRDTFPTEAAGAPPE